MKVLSLLLALVGLNLVVIPVQSQIIDRAVAPEEKIESILKKYQLVNSTCTVTLTKDLTHFTISVRTGGPTTTSLDFDRDLYTPQTSMAGNESVTLKSARGLEPETSISVIEIPNTGQAVISARQLSRGTVTTQNCILPPK